MSTPDRLFPLRVWRNKIHELAEYDSELREGITTIGDGPFENQHFDSMLRELGLDPDHQANDGSPIVCVGRNAWLDGESRGRLERGVIDAIRGRIGRTIRIYSQELLLVYLSNEIDPYSLDESWLRLLAKGHPALEWLSLNRIDVMGYDWRWPEPAIRGTHSPGSFDPTLLDSGMLAAMGYHSRNRDFAVAVADREEDLCWLKERYFEPSGFSFAWPQPIVRPR